MLSQKSSAKDLLAGLSMLSLDRLTEGGKGYPLLLQSGESYNGVPPVDRQHPHDLFAELAVAYTHSFTKDLDLTSYCGYPGEPAYGKFIATSKVLFTYLSTDLALGLQGTINFPDENLKRIYGNSPLAAEVFLKIAPASMMSHSTSTQ